MNTNLLVGERDFFRGTQKDSTEPRSVMATQAFGAPPASSPAAEETTPILARVTDSHDHEGPASLLHGDGRHKKVPTPQELLVLSHLVIAGNGQSTQPQTKEHAVTGGLGSSRKGSGSPHATNNLGPEEVG